MNYQKLSIIAGWMKYRSSHFTAFVLGALSTSASVHYNNYFIVPATFLILFAVYGAINFSEYVDALNLYIKEQREKEEIKNVIMNKISGLGNGNITITPVGNEGGLEELLSRISNQNDSEINKNKQDKDGGFDISGLFGGEK